MVREGIEDEWLRPAPPIGFALHHDQRGYYALLLTLVRGKEEEGAVEIGRSRFRRVTIRRATRYYREKRAAWEAEQNDNPTRFILAPPKNPPRGPSGISHRR